MHDSVHGLKVAHLMWHILDAERRQRLSPPEIAILVLTAHLHDMGMLLSDEQRNARLAPSSDLWSKLDINREYRQRLASLEQCIRNSHFEDPLNAQALNQINQAQEALLCADTRERHATPDRYQELIAELRSIDNMERQNAPSINECLRFGQDSFERALIDICVSHNEDASVLMESSPSDRSQSRFPRQFPIGSSTADLRLVAATLRLADILDFDRERVPLVLYYYLLPRSGQPSENISVREWQKHLTISSWEFSAETIVFRGRSTNPYAHHAVLKFLADIEVEICRTHAIFPVDEWPFRLAKTINPEIYPDGFRYLPYQFSLTEDKVFPLLMGRNLYPNAFDCIRELIQNSVDACQLKDALLAAYQPSVRPSFENRISIVYKEPSEEDGVAQLVVEDTGTGMDLWVIENYFLRVGESYYSSSEFLRGTGLLNTKNIRFEPVSEFGIGFVSVFMLADRVEIETAMPHSPRKDSTKRILNVDGVGRLIHMTEYENFGYSGFEGTRVSLYLTQSKSRNPDKVWGDLREYIMSTCVDLPYSLRLERVAQNGRSIDKQIVSSSGGSIKLSEEIEKTAHRIAIRDESVGIDGEIVIFEKTPLKEIVTAVISSGLLQSSDMAYVDFNGVPQSLLTRGGFSLGQIPGLPSYVGFVTGSTGQLKVIAGKAIDHRLPRTNLARTELVHTKVVTARVQQAWLEWLLDHIDVVESAQFGSLMQRFVPIDGSNIGWLEKYSAFDVYRLARALSKDALGSEAEDKLLAWERGEIERISLGGFEDYVHRQLFEIVLPRVCTLQIGGEAKPYAAPPSADWKDKLVNCHDFITAPVRWQSFADYIGSLEGLLYFSYPGSKYLCREWEPQFNSFSHDDLEVLTRSFEKIVDSKGHDYFPSLSAKELDLFKSAAKLAPDAQIGSIYGRYTLESFST
ncbi:MAG: ATP-binding protein [Pseudomonadota bacterium]